MCHGSPGHVRRAIAALEPAARRFLFVSSNVYAIQRDLDEDEDAPLLPPLESDVMESMERYGEGKWPASRRSPESSAPTER
jgi:phytoene/squalene synthetase